MKNNKLLKVAAAILVVALAGSVQAAPMLTDISSAIQFEQGDDNNDNVGGGVLDVNTHEMFDFSDWQYAGKDNGLNGVDEAGTVDIGLSLSGGTISGNWTIDSNVWSNYEDVMFVLKGGNGGNDTTNYVGWLLDGSATTGTYDSPFNNPSNGNQKNISHFTAYVRGTGSGTPPTTGVVPEPSTYAMFGTAFLILGFVGYRSRNKKG